MKRIALVMLAAALPLGAAHAAYDLVIGAGWTKTNPDRVVVMNVPQAATLHSVKLDIATPLGAAGHVTVKQAPSGTDCAVNGTALTAAGDVNAAVDTTQSLKILSASLKAGQIICLSTGDPVQWNTGVATVTLSYSIP